MSEPQKNVNLKNVLKQLDDMRRVMSVMNFDFDANSQYNSIYDENSFTTIDTLAKAQRFGMAQQSIAQLSYAISKACDKVHMLQNAIDSEHLQKLRSAQ